MEPVQRAVADTERQRALRLAACERQVTEAQAKLAELTGYRNEYARQFQSRAGQGMGGLGLRDYQTFLARLASAIQAQEEVVVRALTQRDAERSSWQQAATRSKAVEQVVDRWRAEERVASDRREQKDTDERALRSTRLRPQD
jgi:flagellar FliJ protein